MAASSVFLPWLAGMLRVSTGLVDWLMTYAIHSTVLIGGVWLLLASRPGRMLSPTHTAWLWRFALVGGILSASLQSFRSPDPLAGTLRVAKTASTLRMVRVDMDRLDQTPWHVPMGGVTNAAPRVQIGTTVGAGPFWRNRASTITLPTPPRNARTVRATIDVQPSWTLAALGLWFLAAALFLGMYLRARRRFHRLLGDRRNGMYTLAGGALRGVRDRAGCRRSVTLTIADRLTSPVALCGDEICIPSRALAELDPIRMESILAHELAHLERHDPAWLTLARVIEAVFFFQPLNRLARAHMQEAAEFASDGWAAGVVSRPLDLAHCLARVAEWTVGSSRILAPAMAERRGRTLVRRVERLTSCAPINRETTNSRSLRLTAAATVLALVLVAPRVTAGPGGGSSPERTGVFMLRVDDTSPSRAGALGRNVDVQYLRFRRN